MWYNKFINIPSSNIILLSYKGKILLQLMERNPVIIDNPVTLLQSYWSFIYVLSTKKTISVELIASKVENETGVKLGNITYISSSGDKLNNYYFAKLSDEDVNGMVRDDGQTLQFYSYKELTRLNLSSSTLLFLEEQKDFFENDFMN